jgi:hypothetical protein
LAGAAAPATHRATAAHSAIFKLVMNSSGSGEA